MATKTTNVVFKQQIYLKIKFTGILIFNRPFESKISDGGFGNLKDFKIFLVALYSLWGLLFLISIFNRFPDWSITKTETIAPCSLLLIDCVG